MEWITIEEFNKDPQDGYYWVYLGDTNDKCLAEYWAQQWSICGVFVNDRNITHVMPIKEPQDP